MIQGVIFDFDGLILDTEGPIFRSWQELFTAHGGELTLAVWGKIIGTAEGAFDPFDLLEEQTGRTVDRAGLAPQRRERERSLIARQPVLPGVEGYLQDARAHGLKIGLASSSTYEWVSGHLARLGLLSYFDCLRTADDVERTKPDPAVYFKVLEDLGMEAVQVFALEDSPNGVLAARRAGLFCVAVPNSLTRELPLDHADLRLEALTEMSLEALIKLVEARQGNSPASQPAPPNGPASP